MLRAGPRGPAFSLASAILDHPRRLRPGGKDQGRQAVRLDEEAAPAERNLVEQRVRGCKGCGAARGGQASLSIAGSDRQPLARLDYVSVADPVSLAELEYEAETALISMAVFIGRIRLIDNLLLRIPSRTR